MDHPTLHQAMIFTPSLSLHLTSTTLRVFSRAIPLSLGTSTILPSSGLKAAAFRILRTQEDISYHERLSRLNLLWLTYWHEVKDSIFYFKCRAGRYTL